MDLFYYGSQDIPPRLGGGKEPREGNGESTGERVCEACGRPVEPEDLRAGRALEIYGVVLCQACGGEDAGSEDRVELYFCDRCHVSVPVCRVDTGEALAGDGRILCLDCRDVRSSRRPLLAFLLVLLGLGAAFGLHELTPPSPAPDHDDILGRLEAKVAGLPRLLVVEDPTREVEAILSRIDDLGKASRERLASLERVRSDLDRLRAKFDRRMRELDAETAALSRDLEDLIRIAEPLR